MADLPSILVVDDDHDVLDSIREVLEEAGYQVRVAHSGAEALAALREMTRPAGMIVDSLMGDMNGGEFLQICASDPTLAGIPAIAISGQRPPDLRLPGAQDFLPKPFGGEQLLGALARVLSTRPPPA